MTDKLDHKYLKKEEVMAETLIEAGLAILGYLLPGLLGIAIWRRTKSLEWALLFTIALARMVQRLQFALH